jgi:uncharacterized membrane protein
MRDISTTRRAVGRRLRQHFLAGLVLLLPFIVSLYVIDVILVWATNATSFLAEGLFGAQVPWPGLWGLLIALGVITVVGLIANQYAGRALFGWLEDWLRRVPVWGSLYDGVKSVITTLMDRKGGAFHRVVLLPLIPGGPGRMIGLVAADADRDGWVRVFVPMSPPTGGFVVVFPEDALEPSELTVEEAMRLLLSAGTLNPSHPLKPAASREPF